MSDKKRGRPKKIATITTPIEPEVVPFTHDQLKDALFFIEDMLERSMIPFMLLGNTAKQIVDSGDAILVDTKITLGVRKNALTESASSMLRGLVPAMKWHDNKLFYIHTNGVPVIIYILGNDEYFLRPDSKFWYVTEFRFPNPFLRYWEERGIND